MWEDLRYTVIFAEEKRGIPFKTYHMGIEGTGENRGLYPELTGNDRKRLEALIQEIGRVKGKIPGVASLHERKRKEAGTGRNQAGIKRVQKQSLQHLHQNPAISSIIEAYIAGFFPHSIHNSIKSCIRLVRNLF